MTQERKFPLIIWEHTEEFKKEYEEAKKRLAELYSKWRNYKVEPEHVDLQFDNNGNPEFWINNGPFTDVRPPYGKRNLSVKEALTLSLEKGSGGWWNSDDLERLIRGEGPILEDTMWHYGFRKHKKYSDRWVRKKKDDEDPRHIIWNKKHGREYIGIYGEELEKLNQLWILPNEFAGLNRTYSLEVGSRGMIYVALEVNPFSATRTEDLGWFGAMLRNKGHIARQQSGFYIDARNVKLGEQKGLHVKAIRSGQSHLECIWPTQLPQPKIYDLADEFVSKVNSN